jgi:hypothetical protein
MADDDDDKADFIRRFDAISVPEMRRRVDLAIGYVREMRRALAVQAGMTAEQAPGPIPSIDPEQGKHMFEEIVKMLPLLRKPLTDEESARIQRQSPARREQMKEVLEELEANADAFEEIMEQSDLPYRREDIIKWREGMQKEEMLGEVAREAKLLMEELDAHRERLAATLEALTDRMRGPKN